MSADNPGSKDFAHEKRTKALQDAATGTAGGALVGAALALAIAGPAASGPVVAALADAGAGGIVGWLAGLVVGLRLAEYVARRYAGRVRRGGILLSVHCDNALWCARAKKTLKDTGASGISAVPEEAADYGATDQPTERAPEIAADGEQPVAQRPHEG